MKPEQAQAAIAGACREKASASEDWQGAKHREKVHEEALQAARKDITSTYARYRTADAKLKRLQHLADGKCSGVMREGDWQITYRFCERKGKHTCEKCGASTCGVHHRFHRCQEEPQVFR